MPYPPRIERALTCVAGLVNWLPRKTPIEIRHGAQTIRTVLRDVEGILKRADEGMHAAERCLKGDTLSAQEWQSVRESIGLTRAILQLWLQDTKEL